MSPTQSSSNRDRFAILSGKLRHTLDQHRRARRAGSFGDSARHRLDMAEPGYHEAGLAALEAERASSS